jgi:hypothetical protein
VSEVPISNPGVCAACVRAIDASAKLCPYCGANPQTGERFDTQTLVEEVFRPREMSASDSVLEYARQRQGIFIAVSVFVGLVILAAVHQFVTTRNEAVVSDLPAVPLSEITDVTRKNDDITPVPLPKLDFQYDGVPKRMRTYIVEQGAIPPPEVLAGQQAAGQQPAATAARPQPPPPPTR